MSRSSIDDARPLWKVTFPQWTCVIGLSLVTAAELPTVTKQCHAPLFLLRHHHPVVTTAIVDPGQPHRLPTSTTAVDTASTHPVHASHVPASYVDKCSVDASHVDVRQVNSRHVDAV